VSGQTPRQEDDMADPQRLQDGTTGGPLLLTPEEAAQVLRVGRTTIYALMKAGDLRPVHIGRSCRLPRSELERYVDRLQRPPAPPATERKPPRRSRTVARQGELFDVVPSPPAAS
jgi:excisionase family DNA binding protein